MSFWRCKSAKPYVAPKTDFYIGRAVTDDGRPVWALYEFSPSFGTFLKAANKDREVIERARDFLLGDEDVP